MISCPIQLTLIEPVHLTQPDELIPMLMHDHNLQKLAKFIEKRIDHTPWKKIKQQKQHGKEMPQLFRI